MSTKSEDSPSTSFSIQNILNKNFDGVWKTILSGHHAHHHHLRHHSGGQGQGIERSDSPEPHSSRGEWDSEALDMRMKHQLKGKVIFKLYLGLITSKELIIFKFIESLIFILKLRGNYHRKYAYS